MKTYRLWTNDAPGALGSAPEDIPTLTYYSEELNGAIKPAVVVCPGGEGFPVLTILTVIAWHRSKNDLVLEFDEALDKVKDHSPGEFHLLSAVKVGLPFLHRVEATTPFNDVAQTDNVDLANPSLVQNFGVCFQTVKSF